METGPWFKVSSERLEERGVEPVTPGLQDWHANHCATHFVVKCATKILKIRNENFISESIFYYRFCIDKGDNPKSFHLNSGNIRHFVQMLGHLVSLLYYLVLILCIFD